MEGGWRGRGVDGGGVSAELFFCICNSFFGYSIVFLVFCAAPFIFFTIGRFACLVSMLRSGRSIMRCTIILLSFSSSRSLRNFFAFCVLYSSGLGATSAWTYCLWDQQIQ